MADEFEFIDESEVEYSKRGRKPVFVPYLAEAMQALKKAPKGKALPLKNYALDPASESYAKDKARVSAMIRSHAKVAGLTVGIVWSLSGVPTVKRTAK